MSPIPSSPTMASPTRRNLIATSAAAGAIGAALLVAPGRAHAGLTTSVPAAGGRRDPQVPRQHSGGGGRRSPPAYRRYAVARQGNRHRPVPGCATGRAAAPRALLGDRL